MRKKNKKLNGATRDISPQAAPLLKGRNGQLLLLPVMSLQHYLQNLEQLVDRDAASAQVVCRNNRSNTN